MNRNVKIMLSVAYELQTSKCKRVKPSLFKRKSNRGSWSSVAFILFGYYFHALDNYGNSGNVIVPAVVGRGNCCDLVHDVKTLGYFSECGVLTVKVRGLFVHDEDL